MHLSTCERSVVYLVSVVSLASWYRTNDQWTCVTLVASRTVINHSCRLRKMGQRLCSQGQHSSVPNSSHGCHSPDPFQPGQHQQPPLNQTRRPDWLVLVVVFICVLLSLFSILLITDNVILWRRYDGFGRGQRLRSDCRPCHADSPSSFDVTCCDDDYIQKV